MIGRFYCFYVTSRHTVNMLLSIRSEFSSEASSLCWRQFSPVSYSPCFHWSFVRNRAGWNVWWKNISNSLTKRRRIICLLHHLWTGKKRIMFLFDIYIFMLKGSSYKADCTNRFHQICSTAPLWSSEQGLQSYYPLIKERACFYSCILKSKK